MLSTHRAGKGPGGCGGWGLGSRNRRGPGVPPTPGLRGRGTSPGSPAGFLGSSGQGKRPPLLLLLEGPSHLPLLISLASGGLILSDLHFSYSSVPPHPTSSLGGSSHLLGCQGPPPVAGRRPSCGETLTQHLPTPPS